MTTRTFWHRALERAVRAFAAAMIAILTATGFDKYAWEGWTDATFTAAIAGLVSILTSIVASGVGDPSSPSLLKEDA